MNLEVANEIDFLPSQTSRLRLYLLLEKAVYRRIRALHRLPETSISINGGLSSMIKDHRPVENCRERQMSFYRQTALPMLAAALHLNVAYDLQNQNASNQPESKLFKNNHDELVPCLTLLFSNIILLSKGKFDARVRSIVKEVVIPILRDLYTDDEEETKPEIEAVKPSWKVTKLQDLVKDNDDKSHLPSPKALYTFSDPNNIESIKVVEDPKDDTKDEKDDRQMMKIELKPTLNQIAMQRFEAMEKLIANNTLQTLLLEQQSKGRHSNKTFGHIMRGLQIGTVGLLAGGLLVMSGGLAAPGLLAISALVIGVAKGGGLAEYKMKLRSGLSEWRIRKENFRISINSSKDTNRDNTAATSTLQGLHAVVCVSGWLHSAQDFQQPWGVQPHDPPVEDEVKLLEKFFSVFEPHRIHSGKLLLQTNHVKDQKRRKDNKDKMWRQLEENYGRDPRHLLPLDKSQQELPLREETLIDLDIFLQKVIRQQAPETESIYVENRMLIQMELMNAEIFVNMNSEILEAVEKSEKPNSPIMDELGKEDVQKLKETLCIENSTIEGGKLAVKNNKNQDNISSHSSTFTEETAAASFSSQSDDVGSKNMPHNTVCNQLTAGYESVENDAVSELEDVKLNYDWVSGMATSEGGKRNLANEDNLQQKGINDVGENSNSEEGVTPDDKAEEIPVQITNYSNLVWDWEAHYSGELYTLTWETDNLMQLCTSLDTFFEEAIDELSKEVIKQSAKKEKVSDVSDVATPLAFSKYADTINNSYQLISYRSEKAGIELAQCLLESDEGRPVSLVGFSFGARVIFAALLELTKHQSKWKQQQQLQKEQQQSTSKERLKRLTWKPRETHNKLVKSLSEKFSDLNNSSSNENKNGDEKLVQSDEPSNIIYKREPASLIEDVILIGMPCEINNEEWIQCRELVAGRLVNCYNKLDWALSYMINSRCWDNPIAACGTHPIINMEGIVENYDISHLSSSHRQYPSAMPNILHHIQFGTPCT